VPSTFHSYDNISLQSSNSIFDFDVAVYKPRRSFDRIPQRPPLGHIRHSLQDLPLSPFALPSCASKIPSPKGVPEGEAGVGQRPVPPPAVLAAQLQKTQA
jgi:hypothetical protein